MRRLTHLTGAAPVGAFGLAWSASAQQPPEMELMPACHIHADLTAMLNQKYAEAPNAVGVQANGHLVEVLHPMTAPAGQL